MGVRSLGGAGVADVAGLRWCSFVAFFAFLSFATGCSAGFSARTASMRTALDAGDTRRAIDALDKELRVDADNELPPKLIEDDALLVLDRATLQHSLAQLTNAQRDYGAADKALDMLDLSRAGIDEVGKWAFSDASGPYVAPAYEKILVNTLNMAAYLETNDLSNARVEARRLGVIGTYLRDRGRLAPTKDNTHVTRTYALGASLAALVAALSGDSDDARVWREDADHLGGSPLHEVDLRKNEDARDDADLILIVGWGRAPHREANRLPAASAFAQVASIYPPEKAAEARALLAQGLVTWINYPSLAPSKTPRWLPTARVGDTPVPLTPSLDVDGVARAHFASIEAKVMAAALSRAIVRVVAGRAIEALSKASKDKGVQAAGSILGLVVQASMAAADTPDTRNWETLPAQLSVTRVRVDAGTHRVDLGAGDRGREGRLEVPAGGYRAVSLLSLR